MAETGLEHQRIISDALGRNPVFQSESSIINSDATSPPVLIREVVALVLLIIVSDLTLYRSEGFLGPGVLFLVAPLLIAIGKYRWNVDVSLLVMVPMLWFLSARLAWCGSYLATAIGFVLLCGVTMGLSGIRPYLTRAMNFAFQVATAGFCGILQYLRTATRFCPSFMRTQWFAFGLPVLTLLTFASIFVLANPDLVKSFVQRLTQFVDALDRLMQNFQFTEILFCAGAGWIATGLLRPAGNAVETLQPSGQNTAETAKSPYYEAYRNTLAVVIALFALYLLFEFNTLWFKTFPQGFYYSGYAHEGAAWLTVALGLSTVILSLIFRGTILADPRMSHLRTLSWIWSMENLLLAIAVFNRLFIYIGFNGMTRMRVVGILGVASVVIGFVLVLKKIAQNHDFTWLVRRQLWTVAFAIYLYAVLPVDAFVNQFNVNRILAGDPRPSVQISVHPTSDEGWLCLKSLIDCSDSQIRDGIRGLLDKKLREMESKESVSDDAGWSARQFASDRLLDQLRVAQSRWTADPWWNATDNTARQEVITKFREYAYQWY